MEKQIYFKAVYEKIKNCYLWIREEVSTF